MHSKERILSDLNDLLQIFDLPILEDLNEVSVRLLIALYESLKNCRLEIPRCARLDVADEKQGLSRLLSAISQDVTGLDTSVFDTQSPLEPDSSQFVNFIDIFTSLGRILSISRGFRKNVETFLDASSVNLPTVEASTQSISQSEQKQIKARATKLFSNKKLTHLLSPAHSIISQTSRPETRAKARRAARKRMRLACASTADSRPATRSPEKQSVRTKSVKRCAAHLIFPSDMSFPLAAAGEDSTAKESSLRLSADRHRPCTVPVIDPLSFFSETSIKGPVRSAMLVDSPYTKYLKARRELVLHGISLKLSPLRSPVAEKARQGVSKVLSGQNKMKPRLHRLVRAREEVYGQSPLRRHPKTMAPSPLKWQSTGSLLSSIASSKDSDQSFYEE